ncbi:hypothetical protein F0U60_15855 [Archangium minus]|uniref:Uncharacterized protein n=1 Tax=Archangium minus TaxID=83450 RepID=A0ABY9WUG3_9BACT|nr:hypothetical protein F0U60_15855 [Archangium minus]
MSDTTSRKSRRFGPFQLGRRCKHAAVELGPIHEAHNVRTGDPVLVLTPGSRSLGRLKRDWQVRVYVQATPPFVALEVERAPVSGRLSELTDMLLLLLAGLDAVGHSARVRGHLTRERMDRPRRLSVLWGLAAAAVALLVLGGGFWWGSTSRPMDSSAPAPSAPGVASPAEAGLQSSFLTAGGTRGPAGIAYRLPDKPLQGQARPPCDTERDEVVINGGCWVALERRPPCHKEQAEYQGKCYLPVSAKPRLPQSLDP